MNLFDDIRIYLPKYLSPEKQADLFLELEAFPGNIHKRFYSAFVAQQKNILQGDTFKDILLADHVRREFYKAKALCISNTCDMFSDNQSLNREAFITVAPLFDLNGYQRSLKEKLDKGKWDNIDQHVKAIREQKLTRYFYLPKHSYQFAECFAKLDMVQSFPVSFFRPEQILCQKISSLSNYGFYLFLLKLSIHFTRVQETLDRDDPATTW